MLSVLLGVIAGGAIGVANGLAITRLKVIPFIATLGMLGVARGMAKWLADQQTVNVPETWINELAVTFPRPDWLLVAPGVWLTLAARDRRCAGAAADGLRPSGVRDRFERGRGAGVRDPGGPAEDLDLRPRRPALRAVRA